MQLFSGDLLHQVTHSGSAQLLNCIRKIYNLNTMQTLLDVTLCEHVPTNTHTYTDDGMKMYFCEEKKRNAKTDRLTAAKLVVQDHNFNFIFTAPSFCRASVVDRSCCCCCCCILIVAGFALWSVLFMRQIPWKAIKCPMYVTILIWHRPPFPGHGRSDEWNIL